MIINDWSMTQELPQMFWTCSKLQDSARTQSRCSEMFPGTNTNKQEYHAEYSKNTKFRTSITCIVGNGQVPQWDLMAKSTFCRVETKCMLIYTRLSAPKRFAMDGKLERFVTKKMKKAVAKLESERLYSNRDFRLTWRRLKGNDFSYKCATYQPKSILITFCNLYFHKYTMFAD